MTKKVKKLVIKIDGCVYHSSFAPDVEYDGAMNCPACGSSRYYHVATIVQHGFVNDNCLSLVTCETCGETFHYQYHIESMYAVLWAYQELEPPPGGLNNIEQIGQQ